MFGNFEDSVATAIRGTMCAVLAVSDNMVRFQNEIYSAFPQTPNIGRALRRQLCDDDSDTFTLPPPEVPGGQCPGVSYLVTITRTTNGVTGNPASANVIGPVVKRTLAGDVVQPIGLPAIPYWGQGIFSGTSDTTLLSNVSSTQSGGQGRTITVVSVVRNDGQPDNCGDQTAPIPPWQPIIEETNVTYINNEGDEVTENFNLAIFAPIISINGTIEVPIELNGTVEFSGTVEISPNFEVNIGPKGTKPPTPTTDPNTDIPDNPPTEYPPEENTNRVIVGCLVKVTDAEGGLASSIAQSGGNPTIYAPRLGNVSFQIETAAGRGWTEDYPVKNTSTYIPCPVDFGATAVRGSPNTGYSMTVIPVYRNLRASA